MWRSSANRLAEVEAQVQHENAALDAEAKRESAALASLDKRVSALEAGAGASGAPNSTSASRRWRRRTPTTGPTRPPPRKPPSKRRKPTSNWRRRSRTCEPTSTPRAARFQGLRRGSPSSRPKRRRRTTPIFPPSPPVSTRSRRRSPRRRAKRRVAPEKPAPADNAAAIAIIAGAIADRLAAGAPFGTEVAALQRLGVDPAQLAALQAVADGAPTGSALAASFDAVAPRVLAAASPGESGGVLDRLLAHLRGLVRVHDLGEIRGRRSRGDHLPHRGRVPPRRHRAARSPRSTSCRRPRVRRRAIGRSRPGRGRRRTPPCSRSARRRSGGSRAALAHDIAAAGRSRGFRRAAWAF